MSFLLPLTASHIQLPPPYQKLTITIQCLSQHLPPANQRLVGNFDRLFAGAVALAIPLVFGALGGVLGFWGALALLVTAGIGALFGIAA